MYEWPNQHDKAKKFALLRKYVEFYSENGLFQKVAEVGLKIGVEILFYAMVLYYVLTDGKVSLKNKLIIMGALGYFILPTDLVADFIPLLGFSDDAAFLSFALAGVADAITPEIKEKARRKINDLLDKEMDAERFTWSKQIKEKP